MLISLAVLFYISHYLEACIPTQTVDDGSSSGGGSATTAIPGSQTRTTVSGTTTTTTTTTVATTTTIPPDPASPCTGCPKIYDSTCAGFQNLLDPWCAPQSQVGNLYILGVIAGFGDSNTCSTTFACPVGTTSQYELFGFTLPGPPIVIAYCQQDGPNAGDWFYGIPPLATPIKLKSLTCVGLSLGKK